MTKCDGASLGIETVKSNLPVTLCLELMQDGENLDGECLVYFDNVCALETDPGRCQNFPDGMNRTEPHSPRGTAGDRIVTEATKRLHP